MAMITIPDGFLMPEERCSIFMQGVGYDIANSDKIPENEKMSLIKACKKFFLTGESFTTRQRSLLYRIRKDYHIQQSGLCDEAKPASFWDEISNY